MNRTAKKAKYQNVLEELFLFRNVPKDEVEAVYSSSECECVEFFPGEMVFTRNQYRRSLGIVLSGELRAVSYTHLCSGSFLWFVCSAGG